MKFQELSTYKTEIIDRILANENICKALHYTDTNFREQPHLQDTSILQGKNIFPHTFVPKISETKTSYITVTFRRFRSISNGFKSGDIRINIIVHKDLHKTDYSVTRMDYLISEVDKIFNSARGFGVGKLEFYEADEFGVNDQYVGFFVTYRPVERN